MLYTLSRKYLIQETKHKNAGRSRKADLIRLAFTKDLEAVMDWNCCLLTPGTHFLSVIRELGDHLQNPGLHSKFVCVKILTSQLNGQSTQPISPPSTYTLIDLQNLYSRKFQKLWLCWISFLFNYPASIGQGGTVHDCRPLCLVN